MTVKKWLRQNTSSLAGKTVAVSGATGGIGRELTAHLAFLGASLTLLDRNEEKSKRLAEDLRVHFPSVKISHVRVDMEDIDSVKAAADILAETVPDHLILNAGAYSIPRHTCSTGYDNVFQINFVSPYYLARTLLPKIRARGGSVVAVGSIAHNYSKTDPCDVDFSKRTKSSLVYGNAKRHLMFSLYALGKEGGIAVTHPGITLTNITAHYPKLVFAVIKHPMKVIFMSPKKASLSILRGVFEDSSENEWIGPRLFSIWGFPKRSTLRTCGEDEARAIRETADRIYRELSTPRT